MLWQARRTFAVFPLNLKKLAALVLGMVQVYNNSWPHLKVFHMSIVNGNFFGQDSAHWFSIFCLAEKPVHQPVP